MKRVIAMLMVIVLTLSGCSNGNKDIKKETMSKADTYNYLDTITDSFFNTFYQSGTEDKFTKKANATIRAIEVEVEGIRENYQADKSPAKELIDTGDGFVKSLKNRLEGDKGKEEEYMNKAYESVFVVVLDYLGGDMPETLQLMVDTYAK